MPEYVTKDEHAEFAKRIEDENARQNHRIANLEESVQNIQRLTVSVEKMGVNMQYMADKQAEIAGRLNELEEQPGANWRALKSGIIGAIAAAIGAALVAALLHGGI